jgi:EF hand domain-containing protein
MRTGPAMVIAGIVVITGITVGIVLPRLGSSKNDTNAAEHRDPNENGEKGALNANPGDMTSGQPDDALERLQAQLDGAAALEIETKEQRLAEARAWVAANRPVGRLYNELEARILALLSAVHDGARHSALWAINTAMIEIETLRALDTNGDGVFSDDELVAFLADDSAVPDPLDHPYFEDSFDNEAALVAVLERARLEAWDTDLDGQLSDAERAAGEAGESQARIDFLVARELDAMERDGIFEEYQDRHEYEAALRDRFALSLEGVDLTEAAMLTAESLLYAMRMEDLSDDAVRADLTANMDLPPDLESFDANGDGDMDAAETQAWSRANAVYDRSMQSLAARSRADFLRHRYGAMTVAGDRNHDGRLTAREWEALIDLLIIARDQRLFIHSYDLDGNNRVDENELMTFMDWYNADSQRADVNFDGLVDARDLEETMLRYQRQGNQTQN